MLDGSVSDAAVEETASAESMHRKEAGSLLELMHHKRALLIVLAFTMGGSLYFYTFTTYMQNTWSTRLTWIPRP